MGFVLDTNVISELVRPEPDEHVVRWVGSADESRLCLTSTVVAEISRGVWRLPPSQRRTKLELWLHQALLQRFQDRILPFDKEAALIWGRLMGEGEREGRTPPDRDCQIAAVALAHGHGIVTRNVRDFEHFEVVTINPWG